MRSFSFYAVVDRDCANDHGAGRRALNRRSGKLSEGQLGFDHDPNRRKLER
jgi:hypothetical protein